MKHNIAWLFALACGNVLSSAVGKSNNLTVETQTGIFTGLIDPEYPNTRQWRAIPFAQPPVASNRWLPPQKISASTDKHTWATKFPPSCPQFVSAIENFWNLPLSQGNLIYNGGQNDTSGLVGEATSEDCLYLAIWAPKGPAPASGWPVMFFMTGGGFMMGGLELPWQIPTPLVERSQSAIVVTINYRVGIFGFPNARGLTDGQQNLGILDQRAALEWVRDNIADFGGDPGRIMHWGRSAGAISADYHAYAWHEEPIAQSYYMESGTAFSMPLSDDTSHSNFTFVAEHVGCEDPCGGACDKGSGEYAAAELDCMRQVSPIQITNFIGQYQDSGETPPLTFTVMPDDRIIFRNYEARSEEGKIAPRPALISFTANEWSTLVPWPKENLTEGPWQPPVTEGGIAFGVCPTFNSTVYRNRLSTKEAPVFRFQYAAEFPNLNVYDWMGAYHNSETSLIFGQYRLLDHIADTTEFQAEVSEAMQDHIMAFLRDPYNGPQETFGWEPQVVDDESGGHILRIGAEGKVVQHVDGFEVDAVCEGLGDYDPFP